MGIQYENLDETTRSFMGAEVRSGGHYLSPRLTPEGQMAWPRLMEDAARSHNDDWLAEQLLSMRYVRSEEPYVRNGVTRLRQINRAHAAQQLGEGEFNRYYIRGLALRAIDAGDTELMIYRGKNVDRPRIESEAKIGTTISVVIALEALRANDFVTIDVVLGIPGGPNSGLSCKLLVQPNGTV